MIDVNNASVWQEKKHFLAYLTVGDGGLERSYDMARAIVKGGATALELGVPFSDPVADGPVIQQAAARAIDLGVTFENVLQLALDISDCQVPKILFTYYNPFYQYWQQHGDNAFATMKQAGIKGMLIVDLPLEESGGEESGGEESGGEYTDYLAKMGEYNLDVIFVASATTSLERIKLLSEIGSGFLYYACEQGTTGVRNTIPEGLAARLFDVRNASCLPVMVGFGIGSREKAESILEHSDGLVVGSRLVSAIAEGLSNSEITKLVEDISPFSN